MSGPFSYYSVDMTTFAQIKSIFMFAVTQQSIDICLFVSKQANKHILNIAIGKYSDFSISIFLPEW